MPKVSGKVYKEIEKAVGKEKMSEIEKNSGELLTQEIIPVEAVRKADSPEQNTVRLIELHGDIGDMLSKCLENALEIGELLREQKDLVKSNGGNFTKWVEVNMPFSLRTAQRYMKLSRCADVIREKDIKTLTDAYDHIKGEPITDEIVDANDSVKIKDDITIKSTINLDTMELPKKKAKGLAQELSLNKPNIDSMVSGEGYEGREERYTKFVIELQRGNIHNKYIGEFVCAAEKYLKPGGKIIFHKR